MTLAEKLAILADSAKYDASCASSGTERKSWGTMGNAAASGICHAWGSDGRCISLLKVLLSNACMYDCAYCINRRSNDVPRASFTDEELIGLLMSFYKRNYIEGLFLSSGIIGSPDHTMERFIRILKILRQREEFGGYIHVKSIPGASPDLVRLAGLFADRMSVNIELPSEQSLCTLAPEKKRPHILGLMGTIRQGILEAHDNSSRFKHAPQFIPSGQSTQLIVGASPEPDLQILKLSSALYETYGLKRVYYSAFAPVKKDSRLPDIVSPPLCRENRLYQADWLLRLYGFSVEEIVSPEHPYLDLDMDPKASWALRNPHYFPIDVARADFDLLLRVPGIGRISAERIMSARRYGVLTPDGLKNLGVVLKRASPFITIKGRSVFSGPSRVQTKNRAIQLSLFGEEDYGV